jgi:hypothetical protein
MVFPELHFESWIENHHSKVNRFFKGFPKLAINILNNMNGRLNELALVLKAMLNCLEMLNQDQVNWKG